MLNRKVSPFSRRKFISRSAAALLLAKLPVRWTGGVYASDAPETSKMKFGMIALTDCSPIVIAHEKGIFKKYGIESTVAKGANWAAIRDSLSSGDLQATHMLIGMPIASTMGLLGSPKKPMIIPWLLNRNGQSISLKASWKGKVTDDPKAINHDPRFKEIRRHVVDFLLSSNARSKVAVSRTLSLPEIEPEDLSIPRNWFSPRKRPIRKSEIKKETVEIGS